MADNELNFSANLDTSAFDKGIGHVIDQVQALSDEVNKRSKDIAAGLAETITTTTATVSNAADKIDQSRQKASQVIEVKMDPKQFIEQNRLLTKSMEEGMIQLAKYQNSFSNLFGMFSKFTGMGLGVSTAFGMVEKMKSIRSGYQQIEIAFETMLGSKEKMEILMDDIKKTAEITPFDLNSVVSGARSLMSYGTSVDVVNEKLTKLGDIAAGMGQSLNDLVFLYGTTMTQGRMFTQDLRQFQGRGIPLADEIAKHFGVAKDKVGELVTAGKVTAQVFDEVLLGMASNGGKFEGLMKNQSATLQGKIENIGDSIDAMFNELGKQSEGVMTEIIGFAGDIVEHWREILELTKYIAAAFAAYKVSDWFTLKPIENEVDELQEKVDQLNRSATSFELEPDLQKLVSAGKMTDEQAAKVQELRNQYNELIDEKGGGDRSKTLEELKKEADARVEEEKRAIAVKKAYEEETKALKELNDERERYLALKQMKGETLKDDSSEDERRYAEGYEKYGQDVMRDFAKGDLSKEEADSIVKSRADAAAAKEKIDNEVADLKSQLDEYDALLANATEKNTAKESAAAVLDEKKSQLEEAQNALNEAMEQLREAAGEQGVEEEEGDAWDALLGQFDIDTLQEKLEEAQAELNEAELVFNTADQEASTATQEAETAAKERDVVANRHEAASETQRSMAKKMGTQASQQSIVASNAEQVAKKKGMIATAAAAVQDKVAAGAKLILAQATNTVKNALNAVKVAFMTNPIGLIITALTTVIGLFMSFKDEAGDAGSEVETFGEAAVKTRDRVNLLYDTLGVLSKSSKMYGDSLKELTKIAEDYGFKLNNEKDKYEQLIELRKQMIELIEEEGRRKQLANQFEEINNDTATARTTLADNLKEYFKGQTDSEEVDKHAEHLARIVVNTVDMQIDKEDSEFMQALSEYDQAYEEYNRAYSKYNNPFAEDKETLTAKFKESEAKYTEAYNKLAEVALKDAKGLVEKSATMDIDDFKYWGLQVDQYIKEYVDTYLQNKGYKQDLAKQMQTSEDQTAAIKASQYKGHDFKNETASKSAAYLNELRDGGIDVNGTVISKPVNDAKELWDSLDKVKEKLVEVNEVKVEVDADGKEVKKVTSDAEALDKVLAKVGDSKLKPFIDTEFIDIAYNKLNDLVNKMRELLPEDKRDLAYTTQEIVELSQLYDEAESSGLFSSITSKQKINEITDRAEARSTFYLQGAGNVRLSSEQAAQQNVLIEQFGENYNKADVMNYRGGDADKYRELYNNLAYAVAYQLANDNQKARETAQANGVSIEDFQGGVTSSLAENEEAFKKESVEKSKKLKTNEEFSSHIKELRSAQSVTPQDSPLWKWLDDEIKRVNKLDRSKQNPQDDAQRAYDRLKAQRKEAKRLQALEKKLNQEQEQFAISQMEEGREKEIAQLRFDERKKTDALLDERDTEAERIEEYEKQQWLKANKERKEYMWELEGSPRKTKEEYEAQAAANIKMNQRIQNSAEETATKLRKIYREDVKAMNDYLKEYGTMTEKRIAIEAQYQESLKKTTNLADRLKAEQEKLKAMRDLDEKQMKDNLHWEVIFGDLDRLSVETLEKYKQQLKDLLPTIDNPETAKVVVDQMNKIDDQILNVMNEERSLYGLSLNYLNERNKRQQEYVQAQEEVNRLLEVQANKQNEVNASRQNLADFLNQLGVKNAEGKEFGGTEAILGESGALSEAQGVLLDRISAAKGRINDNATTPEEMVANDLARREYEEAEAAFKAFQELVASLSKGETDLETVNQQTGDAEAKRDNAEEKAQTTIRDIFEMITELSGKIKQNLDSAGELVTSIFGEDSDVTRVFGNITDGVNNAMGAYESFQKGDYVGAALNATKAIESFGTALGIFGSSDKNLAKDIERLTAVNQELTYAIGKLTDELGEMSTVDAINASVEMKADLEESMRNTQEMMQRSAAAYTTGIGGDHSSNVKIDKQMTAHDWERISKAVGHSVSGAGEFFKLTSEQMAEVRKQAPDLYAKIKQYADDGAEDAAQYMDEFAAYAEQIEQIADAINQKMTGMTFDSVADSFSGMMADMNADARSFSDNFEEMMKNAVLNSMFNDHFRKGLESWYQQWSDSMASGEKLDKSEQARLRKEYEDMAKQAIEMRDEMVEAMGWKHSSSQSGGSSGGFATASQDSVDELNGRFTAMQIDTSAIRSAVENINVCSQQNLGKLMEIGESLDYCRQYGKFQLEELVLIRKNTSVLPEMLERLEKIEKNTEYI